MEVEHIGGASKTIGGGRDGHHDGQHSSGTHTDLAASGGDYTVDDQKAAVIGRSKCKVARKLDQGTTPALGISTQGWGASAAPLPDTPFSAVDELPPPLLDCGQGKIMSTEGADGRTCGSEDGSDDGSDNDGQRSTPPPRAIIRSGKEGGAVARSRPLQRPQSCPDRRELCHHRRHSTAYFIGHGAPCHGRRNR